ncbi:FirrV-1-A34 [Feldmannia irregularis virus a]|uniref:FirrV-1-A34 n=1 Tax=Feldmannia irregularis virus a TaxID=231992 RepID=Q6XM53_9PHYC|nr:FirrV-1-A34 [Feldmannia irregularis virus a]AAR26858.1 FirrV-1-A34 [Feldmannia irregularis virus a]
MDESKVLKTSCFDRRKLATTRHILLRHHTRTPKKMDSILVDPTTGLVGASSLVQYVLPELSASFVRKVTKEAADKAQLSFSKIKHGGTFANALSVDDCLELMANSSQDGIKQWYVSNAETFRRDLGDYVTRKTTQKAGVGRKALCVQRALRSLNIHGSIRVDERSGMVSAIDVIKIVCPDKSEDHAKITLKRMLTRHDHLASKVITVQMNERGRYTPATDLRTIIKIVHILPGAGNVQRCKSMEMLCRVLGGDLDLCEDINENYECWRVAEGGAEIREDLIAPVQPVELEATRESSCYPEIKVRDALALSQGGRTEVCTPSGRIDVLTSREVIEVKYYQKWLHAVGQVQGYGAHYPNLARRLHLFASLDEMCEDKVQTTMQLCKNLCDTLDIRLTFEVVVE